MFTGGVLVSKRLDRALANCDWQSSFPEAFVETLSRLHSDHASLLIRCGGVQQNRGVRPFRFQACGLLILSMSMLYLMPGLVVIISFPLAYVLCVMTL